MAVADINAGGVLGRSSCWRSATTPAIRSRRSPSPTSWRQGVFVAGHFCSGSSIPASKVYTRRASCRSRRPRPTRSSPTRASQGLEQRLSHLRPRRPAGLGRRRLPRRQVQGQAVAVIHDKTAYGKGLADETKKALNKPRVKEAMYEAYTRATRTTPRSYQPDEAGENVDVIYVGGYHTEAGLIVRQAREQGLKARSSAAMRW
jgi:branched-chain amino acid transport system substrate-binding protein